MCTPLETEYLKVQIMKLKSCKFKQTKNILSSSDLTLSNSERYADDEYFVHQNKSEM